MYYYTSMFIDNELDLDEKIGFVKKVHKDEVFYHESLELLEQEKIIRADPVASTQPVSLHKERKWFSLRFLRPFGLFATACAAVAFVLIFMQGPGKKIIHSVPYRFVIFEPGVKNVKISGSFNGWNSIPLKKVGTTGYWQIQMNLPAGEYKYTYIVGDKVITDPTNLTRESDDFGGENSVIYIGA